MVGMFSPSIEPDERKGRTDRRLEGPGSLRHGNGFEPIPPEGTEGRFDRTSGTPYLYGRCYSTGVWVGYTRTTGTVLLPEVSWGRWSGVRWRNDTLDCFNFTEEEDSVHVTGKFKKLTTYHKNISMWKEKKKTINYS